MRPLRRPPTDPPATAPVTGVSGVAAARRRTAIRWLQASLALWSLAALARVLPYLPTSGGDFENLHRGAAALMRGESAFARAELDYPPLVPVLLAPLGLLSLDAARYVWLALSLAAILGALAAVWRLAGGDLAASAAVAVALAVDGSAIPNLALGQMNPLLLLLLAFALLLQRARPAAAASAVGAAAALKIWPGLLLLSFLRGGRAAGVRAAVAGIVAAAVLVALPLGVLALATPPPHLPLAHGYWLGTPALLNFSGPAAVLRASYAWQPGSALPRDWIDGVNSSWRLAPARQRVSLAASLVLLATGLLALVVRSRRASRGATGPAIAGALVALALVAAPIAWYHYQLLQLPAAVLALASALRDGRWRAATLLAATLLLLTHHEIVATAAGPFVAEPASAIYLTGILLPLLGAAWFVSRLAAIGGPASSAAA